MPVEDMWDIQISGAGTLSPARADEGGKEKKNQGENSMQGENRGFSTLLLEVLELSGPQLLVGGNHIHT